MTPSKKDIKSDNQFNLDDGFDNDLNEEHFDEEELDSFDEETPLGLLLFRSKSLDIEQFISLLKKEWDLDAQEIASEERSEILDRNGLAEAEDSQIFLFAIDGRYLFCSFRDTPLEMPLSDVVSVLNPNWKDGRERIEEQESHLAVTVFDEEGCTTLDNYKLYTKIVSSLLGLESAIVYFHESILLEASSFRQEALALKNDLLPIPLWVNIFVDPAGDSEEDSEDGLERWDLMTNGMNNFGKSEFEIINSDKPINELYNFLCDLIIYTLEDDVYFGDNDTIGFSKEEQYRLSLEVSDEGEETIRINI